MKLPIIVIPERHWDTEPKKALIDALPFLISSGYYALYFESPSDESQSEIIESIEITIKFIELQLDKAKELLAKRYIFEDLLSMDFSILAPLLKQWVSTNYYNELALMFRELPGHREKLRLAKMAVEQGVVVQGIDLPSDQLESINSATAQMNIATRVAGINALAEKRNLAFKNNLLTLQKSGKGIIFIVGQSHYQPLIELIAKDHLLSDFLFFHPCSLSYFNSSIEDDWRLPLISDQDELVLLEQPIDNASNRATSVDRLKNKLSEMIKKYVAIPPTVTSQRLSNSTDLDFQPYVNPSHRVDGHHFVNNEKSVEKVAENLNQQGIHGFFTSVENKRSYCVPDINTLDVATLIQNIKL